MFESQRGNSGVGGLLGVAALLAAWIAVGAVMWSAYASPQFRPPEICQLVCRQTGGPANG